MTNKNSQLNENNTIKTAWVAIVRDADTYEVKRVEPFDNVVLDQFKDKVAKAMEGTLDEIGDTIDDFKEKFYLRYEQLGTSDQTAVSTDTDLISPDNSTYKQISSLERDGNEITTYHFWDEGVAIGDWREFALYTEDNVAMVRANIKQDIGEGETLTIHGTITQE